jgi:hypothetical protein
VREALASIENALYCSLSLSLSLSLSHTHTHTQIVKHTLWGGGGGGRMVCYYHTMLNGGLVVDIYGMYGMVW